MTVTIKTKPIGRHPRSDHVIAVTADFQACIEDGTVL